MEWVAALRGKVVGLDTTPLIYFIEENPAYLPTVHPFFEAVDRGEFAVVTSMMTLLEVLVHPFRRGRRTTGTEIPRYSAQRQGPHHRPIFSGYCRGGSAIARGP